MCGPPGSSPSVLTVCSTRHLGYVAVLHELKIIESADFKDHPRDEDHGLFDRPDGTIETDLFEVNSTIIEDMLNISWRILATGDPKGAT